MWIILDLAGLPRVSLGVIPRTADRSAMWAVESFWIYDNDRVTVWDVAWKPGALKYHASRDTVIVWLGSGKLRTIGSPTTMVRLWHPSESMDDEPKDGEPGCFFKEHVPDINELFRVTKST